MRVRRTSMVGQGEAIGGFNVNNLEDIRAVVAAAEDAQTPVILLVSEGALKYAGAPYMAALLGAAAESASVPVHSQLDHGSSLESVVQCIQAGFNSVMIDGSHLPFDENIALTRQAVQLAHACGVWVEGEIGVIGGTEEGLYRGSAGLTPPEQAAEFARLTGVDALAAAVGTAHGFYKERPQIDIARIRAMRAMVDCELVLHGGSDVDEAQIQAAVAAGINKINVGTELKAAYAHTLRGALAADPAAIDPRKALTSARGAMQKLVAEKLRLFRGVLR
ncbi:MAG: class fructose,6-bisphosphate aldolase [Firmicutes bacterium]|nr:class fructose,6-bisphosphate aldolase [Bacillota bacterium]